MVTLGILTDNQCSLCSFKCMPLSRHLTSPADRGHAKDTARHRMGVLQCPYSTAAGGWGEAQLQLTCPNQWACSFPLCTLGCGWLATLLIQNCLLNQSAKARGMIGSWAKWRGGVAAGVDYRYRDELLYWRQADHRQGRGAMEQQYR